MFHDGYGYNQIVAALQEKGYRSRYGRPIGKNTLHDILRNEKYTGVYICNLTDGKDALGKRNSHRKKDSEDVIRVEGGMPAIITKELFQQVQAKLDANKQKPRRQKAKELYLLSGLIVCGECLNNRLRIRHDGEHQVQRAQQAEIRHLPLRKPRPVKGLPKP